MGTQERSDNSSLYSCVIDNEKPYVYYDGYGLNLSADKYEGITMRTKRYNVYIFYLEGKVYLTDITNNKEYYLELDIINLLKSKAKVKNVFDLRTGKQLDEAIDKLLNLKAFL